MLIDTISKAYWMDKEARKQLARLVREALAGVIVPIATGPLLLKCGVDMGDAKAVKNCLQHLANARRDGMLDGYFTAGPARPGTFGKPSYKWHDVKA